MSIENYNTECIQILKFNRSNPKRDGWRKVDKISNPNLVVDSRQKCFIWFYVQRTQHEVADKLWKVLKAVNITECNILHKLNFKINKVLNKSLKF